MPSLAEFHSTVTRELWQGLLEQIEAFGRELRRDEGQPGDMSARAGQAVDQLHLDRFADGEHDDGDGAGRLLGSDGRGRTRGDQHVHLEADELRAERGKPLRSALRIPDLQRDVPALDVAELAQAL